VDEAYRWADAFTTPPPDQPLLWIENPHLIKARILLARRSDADLRLAIQILDALFEIAERTHNTRYKIEILGLRALALDAVAQRAGAHSAHGEIDQAEAVLKQAVDLAQPGGFIRVFVDLGVPMQRLLRNLAQQDHSVEMIGSILAAFPDVGNNLDSGASPAGPMPHPPLGISTLAEPLTPRELEVLTLLREPLSIKEIALKLNISYATVKRHTINLYGKLSVNQRWNAVARAEELNLIPPR
jgi:LuxR family maltose regulon positive regulatory protein